MNKKIISVMMSVINKVKSNILLSTGIYILVFVVLKIFLMILEIEFMQYIYKFSLFVIVIGLISGLIQLAHKNESKIVKVSIGLLITAIAILGTIYAQIILLLYVAYFPTEHVVEKENGKMVGYVHSFLRTRVDYYEYINFFLRGENIDFSEDYGKGGFDPIENPNIHAVSGYTYYDKNGKAIDHKYIEQPTSQEPKQEEQKEEEQRPFNYEDGYEIFFNEKEACRVDVVDWAMGEEAIKVYTTNDGENWNSQLETNNGVMWVHYNSKFLFINPKIGFIYDPGRDGNSEDYSTLKVTVNGGKSYQNCNIIHPANITEKNLLIKDLPIYEDGILKLTIYTLNHSKEPKKTYYEFISNDGIEWKYNKDL